MTDIFEEVLNDEKDEKRISKFRNFLPNIIIITLIGALLVGAYNWNIAKKTLENQTTGDAITQLILNNNDQANYSNLQKLLQQTSSKQDELLKLYEINSLINAQADAATILEKLETIIDNKNTAEITSAYARITWLNIMLNKKNLTDSEEHRIKNYFESFQSDDQPFYFNMLILKALYHLSKNDIDLAKQYAQKIRNAQNVSSLLREQANALISAIEKN